MSPDLIKLHKLERDLNLKASEIEIFSYFDQKSHTLSIKNILSPAFNLKSSVEVMQE